MMHSEEIPRQVWRSSGNSMEFPEIPQLNYFPTKFTDDEFFDDPVLMDDCPIEDFLVDFDGSDHGQWSPLSSSSSLRSDESTVTEVSRGCSMLTLPGEDMEIDAQLSLYHLMKAYGEAMKNGQADLMEVLSRSVADKADPLGQVHDRLMFNLFQRTGSQGRGENDYIRQESQRNTEIAFQAFYQGFLFGRFAHFAANSSIMESAPRGYGVVIRVVDFELENGVQWVPVIEAIAARRDGSILRLTSIKEEEEEIAYDNHKSPDPESSSCRFHDTSRRLHEHAREFGLELKVEEMTIDELLREAKEGMEMYGQRREWIAFNCMVGLMGRKTRSRKQLGIFLSAAQEIITANNCGILTFGEGDAFWKLKSSFSFNDFFEGCVGHYKSVMECMEAEFPSELSEARLAMEALFVSPSINPSTWGEAWDEGKAFSGVMDGIRARLGGLRLSRKRLMEARELVRGNNKSNYYGVVMGELENQMVLEWRGNPLVRLSAWGR